MYNIERWPNIFLKKILQYEHRKIFQVCLTIFHHYAIFYHHDIFHHHAYLRENLFMCSYELSVKIFRPWKEKTSTKLVHFNEEGILGKGFAYGSRKVQGFKSTQLFNHNRSTKWLPGMSVELLVKSNLYSRSGLAALRQANPFCY